MLLLFRFVFERSCIKFSNIINFVVASILSWDNNLPTCRAIVIKWKLNFKLVKVLGLPSLLRIQPGHRKSICHFAKKRRRGRRNLYNTKKHSFSSFGSESRIRFVKKKFWKILVKIMVLLQPQSDAPNFQVSSFTKHCFSNFKKLDRFTNKRSSFLKHLP